MASDEETYDNPLDLIGLLPLRPQNGRDLVDGFFLLPLILFPREWQHFLTRSFEVRSVSWSERAPHWPICSESFYHLSCQIFFGHTALLPLAHIFSVTCVSTVGLRGMTLWIPGRYHLRHLQLTLGPNVGPEAVRLCFEHVRAQQPVLESLSITWNSQFASSVEMCSVGHALADMLAVMPSLATVRIPIDLALVNDASVWRQLAALPHLRVLELFAPTAELELSAPPAFNGVSFASLRTLVGSGPLLLLAYLVRSASAPISQLELRSPYLGGPYELSSALQVIAAACPGLHELSIEIASARHDTRETAEWLDIHAVVLCTELRQLRFSHPLNSALLANGTKRIIKQTLNQLRRVNYDPPAAWRSTGPQSR